MSKAEVLNLASVLSLDKAAVEMLPRYYDEEIFALGASSYLLDAAVLPVNEQGAVFRFPDDALMLLDVIWDGRILDYASNNQLTLINRRWSDEIGPPLCYTTESLSERTFQLYPKPPQTSEAMNFAFGSPLGLDFPAYSVTVIYTKFQYDLPQQLELPIIYKMLMREFKRESPHMDAIWAEASEQLSMVLLNHLELARIV